MSGNNGTIVNDPKDEVHGPTDLYGYIPSKTIAVIFIALFLITTITHTVQSFKYRQRFILITAVLCGIIELVGWSGRIWSAFNSINPTPFQIQITCTIIAPTPLLAANFVIFGRIIRRLGAGYSRLRPRLYSQIFASSDVISLAVQAFGGALAAGASTPEKANRGSHIMLVGIFIQLLIMVLFAACMTEVLIRHKNGTPVPGRIVRENKIAAADDEDFRTELTREVRTMIYVLIFTTTLLFIRAIYRTAELADGWDGKIIRTQVYFNVLDAMMVTLAMYATNFFHPGRLLAIPRTAVYRLDSV